MSELEYAAEQATAPSVSTRPSAAAPTAGAALLERAAAERERLAQMIDEMQEITTKRSETIGKLSLALSKAQGQIENAIKASKNPFLKSTYADLAAVRDACKGPLSENEIAVFQLPQSRGRLVSITTLLSHPSDEWIESTLILVAKDDAPQSVVAAVTYGRRCALAAMVGVAPEDDDGDKATRDTAPRQQSAFQPQQAEERQDEKETPTAKPAPVAPRLDTGPSDTTARGGVSGGSGEAPASPPPPPVARPRARASASPATPTTEPPAAAAGAVEGIVVGPPPPGMKPPARLPNG